MNLKFIALILSIFSLALPSYAQASRRNTKGHPSVLEDSLANIGRRYSFAIDSLNKALAEEGRNEKENLENPYYFPLFASSTFYRFPVHLELGSLQQDDFSLQSSIAQALMQLYAHRPELIQYNLSHHKDDGKNAVVAKPSALPKEKNKPMAPPKLSAEQLALWQDFEPLQLQIHRPNFWSFKGNFSLQFMQYLVSDNWYKGGEDHNSFLTSGILEANYDNKQKFTFTNKLEMKLGFQTSQSDSLHKYKTNADLLRLTNKIGLQAFKHWYYTAMLQTWSQFYPGYHANDKRVFSDFASPIETVFSIGMDYKYKNPKFEISATMSPIAANYKYVARLALAERYGVEKGKHSRLNLGSTVTINMRWTPNSWFQWTTRFYAFTSYSKTQAEWENTISLRANKHLSTKLFLFPRFDDGVKRRNNTSFFQFNEYLSVGLDLGL
ncbi:DUF3078 domain-containing protein [Alloprevotella sp. oral taxon 473]|uniref:DUF3078 domain-containing protein n=1 Tax=Alloprevotella sp. oral taxon 473 TaxID=712469 RepID=UPI0002A2A17B|nr:DUF3078 domain-containing protein [Alloprevotella sp. oral taxon 473]EKX88272.1 hypothetical protein HMPREF9999_02057 [Alloprevotella sp. oral taxon 473 str. F0040]